MQRVRKQRNGARYEGEIYIRSLPREEKERDATAGRRCEKRLLVHTLTPLSLVQNETKRDETR